MAKQRSKFWDCCCVEEWKGVTERLKVGNERGKSEERILRGHFRGEMA